MLKSLEVAFDIRGTEYTDYRYEYLTIGETFSIVPETHPEDPNALRIEDTHKRLVGYVPRDLAQVLVKPLKANQINYKCTITWIQGKRISVLVTTTPNKGNSYGDPNK